MEFDPVCNLQVEGEQAERWLIDEVGSVKSSDELSPEAELAIFRAAMLLEVARLGRDKLTADGVADAFKLLFSELKLEYPVRMELVERVGRWSWRDDHGYGSVKELVQMAPQVRGWLLRWIEPYNKTSLPPYYA